MIGIRILQPQFMCISHNSNLSRWQRKETKMDKQPYQDVTCSFEERARDLVSKMTLEEKASQLRFDAPPVKRLGIPAYNWWNEALHGVARAGTATTFPQAIGMAAMFDQEMMYNIGDIISKEGRAKYNMSVEEGDRDIYKGLTFWSPNVNIFRDPRWGRGHETYGEDPYLTAELGKQFVKGIQQKDEKGYMRAAACAKHYAVHSGPERIRHEFNAEVSQKDLWETYLPAFEALVTEADVEAVMGAYNRTNGEPCCGSKTLLKDILRGKWGFKGHIVSDCWAIRDFHTTHNVTADMEESAALALQNGCDINCGCTYLYLLAACEKGLITEEQITEAAIHAMTTRFKLGLFDEDCSFNKIPYNITACKEHLAVAEKAAEESMVLLKNDGLLPLNKERLKSIAVIGPNANSRVALMGNYHGTAERYITPLEGIQDYAGEDIRVYYSEGCHLYKERVERLALPDDRISEAVAISKLSDVVILCLGLDETIEGEEQDKAAAISDKGDKKDLYLPESQRKLLNAITKTGKPVVLLLSTGSAMIIREAEQRCSAILQTWYPGGHGGTAIARVLFGDVSPAGKLPITFYRSMEDLPDFCDYSMENRTYRNFKGEPLYPFGYGLTYGRIVLKGIQTKSEDIPTNGITVTATVENVGCIDTDEVLQIYIKDMESKNAVRNHSLCAFSRIFVKVGETKEINLKVSPVAFTAIDENGERKIESHKFRIFVGFSQPDNRSVALTGQRPLEEELTF